MTDTPETEAQRWARVHGVGPPPDRTPEPWTLNRTEDYEGEHEYPFFVVNHPLQAFVADVLKEADARLIAAAPALLAALERIEARGRDEVHLWAQGIDREARLHDLLWDCIREARAAIAQAKGDG